MIDDKTATKFLLLLFSVIYILLFPLLFLGAFFWSADSNPCNLLGYIAIFACFSIPFSIPLTICMMWFNYRKARYKAALLCCAIPFLAFGVFLAVNEVIEILGLRTVH